MNNRSSSYQISYISNCIDIHTHIYILFYMRYMIQYVQSIKYICCIVPINNDVSCKVSSKFFFYKKQHCVTLKHEWDAHDNHLSYRGQQNKDNWYKNNLQHGIYTIICNMRTDNDNYVFGYIWVTLYN